MNLMVLRVQSSIIAFFSSGGIVVIHSRIIVRIAAFRVSGVLAFSTASMVLSCTGINRSVLRHRLIWSMLCL